MLYSVLIEAQIWDRDSHGLYDYECKNLVKSTLKVTGCSKEDNLNNHIWCRCDIKEGTNFESFATAC